MKVIISHTQSEKEKEKNWNLPDDSITKTLKNIGVENRGVEAFFNDLFC